MPGAAAGYFGPDKLIIWAAAGLVGLVVAAGSSSFYPWLVLVGIHPLGVAVWAALVNAVLQLSVYIHGLF